MCLCLRHLFTSSSSFVLNVTQLIILSSALKKKIAGPTDALMGKYARV